jgi:uncharacterized protein YjbJ (UPF0337 family)
MSGKIEKTKGRAKETLGRALGNKKLEREGKREHAVGELKDKAHKAKEKLEEELDRRLNPEDHEDEDVPSHNHPHHD